MLAVMPQWEPRAFLRGDRRSDGLLQNTSCVLPFGTAKILLFNFAPSKISLVTLLGCSKRAKEYQYGAREARLAISKIANRQGTKSQP